MPDPSTLTFTLTYISTLGVSLIMFVGQFVAFMMLLALAGTTTLLCRAVQALVARQSG